MLGYPRPRGHKDGHIEVRRQEITMTGEDLKRLRAHYHALLGHQQVLADLADSNHFLVSEEVIRPLDSELAALRSDFPNLVPVSVQLSHALGHREDSGAYYTVAALRTLLPSILSRLQVEIEEALEVSPVTQARNFTFIQDVGLRKIIERDYVEVQRAFIAQCWKSVIILSGGALEAILLDLALANESGAKASAKAPKKPDLRAWDLNDLIEVCVDLKLIGPYAKSVSDATRFYRNLVPPGVELRTKLAFAQEEARIALTVLEMLHRHLSP